MKRCPTCRRDYHDDSLLYCLDDGPSTAIMHDTAAHGEAATIEQIDATEKTAALPSAQAAPARVFRKSLLLIRVALGMIVLIRGFLT